MEQNFITQNIIISVIVSAVVTAGAVILNIINGAVGVWWHYAVLFVTAFGACSIVWSIVVMLCNAGIIGIYDNEYDEKVVTHFYDKYVNGIALVYEITSVGKYSSAKYGFIDEGGNYITSEMFDGAGDFSNGVSACVMKDGKFNLLSRDGKILCSEWFANMSDFYDGKAKVIRENGTVNFVRVDGTLCWKYWKDETPS